MTSAIYVRVSTDRQALAQTIDQQIERLQAHLLGEGEELRAEYIFRDDGYSGATLNRPGLDRLRDQLREGVIDRVLILSPDRLARNYVHQMVILEEVERYGCRIDFLDHPMSQDPHDHLLWICSHDTGHMWEESSPHPVLTRFMRLQKEL
jgi:site-specific DNA recombinase